MDRDGAVEHIYSEFPALLSKADITVDDSPAGLKGVLDQSLRQLDYAEADLATADITTSVANYTALLEYYALRRIWRQLAIKYNWSVDGETQTEQGLFNNVTTLLNEAKATVTGLGYAVDSTASFAIGRFNLDFLEPRGY